MRYALFVLLLLCSPTAGAQHYPATHRAGELYCGSQDAAWRLGFDLTNRQTSQQEREHIARSHGCAVLAEDARVLSDGVIAPDSGMPFVLFRARLVPAGMEPEDAERSADTLAYAYFLLLPP